MRNNQQYPEPTPRAAGVTNRTNRYRLAVALAVLIVTSTGFAALWLRPALPDQHTSGMAGQTPTPTPAPTPTALLAQVTHPVTQEGANLPTQIATAQPTQEPTQTETQMPLNMNAFVVRSGTRLLLDGRPFRFSGPNIYWLGLAEIPQVRYPSEFEVNDALATASRMGATVVRSHSLGFSTGCALCIEPSLGKFNETALRHVDYAIKTARDYGIRLVLPLTDNSYYYSGGKRDFSLWRGIADETQFYTNARVMGDFKQFISTMLNRVNSYTGIAYKDDPTILAWETGNELDAPPSWVDNISHYIKGIDHNHLVVDGNWGSTQLTADLALPACDIYSIHGYPMSIADLDRFASQTEQAGKSFMVGEYGWKNLDKNGGESGDPLQGYLGKIESLPAVAGDLYWDLYPHSETHGFVQHRDESNVDAFTLHYPGDTADMRERAQALMAHAFKMRGVPVPTEPAPSAPQITGVRRASGSNVITWRGAAGGDTYTIERAPSASGPWNSLCDRCVTDNSPPWADNDPLASTTWYRVTAYNLDGVAGPPSEPYRFRPPTQ